MPPTEGSLVAALRQYEFFVYCGHGDGRRYMAADQLQRLPRCAVSLLMGCSSGALRVAGPGAAPTGMPLHYLHARCPALVANLWDVTDGDIDRYCAALVGAATAGGSLPKAVAAARAACRLPFLTGAAAVCYGVPVATLPCDAEGSQAADVPMTPVPPRTVQRGPRPRAGARQQ